MSVAGLGAAGQAGLTKGLVSPLKTAEKTGVPFADYLKQALQETNTLITESEKLADAFAAGRTDNIHQVLLAAEKADIALQFTMQIRNKIMDSYNEIMRMQI